MTLRGDPRSHRRPGDEPSARGAGSETSDGRRELADWLVRTLPGCRPETIGLLTRTARIRLAAPEETIYRQGDPVPLVLILDGYGAFRRTTAKGQLLLSGIGRTGDLFGFTSMTAVLSSVELVSLTGCRVAQWPGSEIRALAATDETFALKAVDSMAHALHGLMEQVDGYLHQDARGRVMRILRRHQDLFFGEPAILTRAHLPGLVGTSREMTGAGPAPAGVRGHDRAGRTGRAPTAPSGRARGRHGIGAAVAAPENDRYSFGHGGVAQW